MKVEMAVLEVKVAVPKKPRGFCGRQATLTLTIVPLPVVSADVAVDDRFYTELFPLSGTLAALACDSTRVTSFL